MLNRCSDCKNFPNAGLVIPTGTQTNEGNPEIETHAISVEARMSKCPT